MKIHIIPIAHSMTFTFHSFINSIPSHQTDKKNRVCQSYHKGNGTYLHVITKQTTNTAPVESWGSNLSQFRSN